MLHLGAKSVQAWLNHPNNPLALPSPIPSPVPIPSLNHPLARCQSQPPAQPPASITCWRVAKPSCQTGILLPAVAQPISFTPWRGQQRAQRTAHAQCAKRKEGRTYVHTSAHNQQGKRNGWNTMDMHRANERGTKAMRRVTRQLNCHNILSRHWADGAKAMRRVTSQPNCRALHVPRARPSVRVVRVAL